MPNWWLDRCCCSTPESHQLDLANKVSDTFCEQPLEWHQRIELLSHYEDEYAPPKNDFARDPDLELKFWEISDRSQLQSPQLAAWAQNVTRSREPAEASVDSAASQGPPVFAATTTSVFHHYNAAPSSAAVPAPAQTPEPWQKPRLAQRDSAKFIMEDLDSIDTEAIAAAMGSQVSSISIHAHELISSESALYEPVIQAQVTLSELCAAGSFSTDDCSVGDEREVDLQFAVEMLVVRKNRFSQVPGFVVVVEAAGLQIGAASRGEWRSLPWAEISRADFEDAIDQLFDCAFTKAQFSAISEEELQKLQPRTAVIYAASRQVPYILVFATAADQRLFWRQVEARR